MPATPRAYNRMVMATLASLCAADLKDHENLTPEDERALLRAAQAGTRRERQHARGEIVRRCLPFVIRQVAAATADTELARDLLQEATIALDGAIDKFDLAAENRFLTYGSWWTRQAIGQYMANNAHVVRAKSSLRNKGAGRALREADAALLREGKTPTDSLRQRHAAATLGVEESKVRAYANATGGYVSLDQPVDMGDGESTTTTLGDLLVDDAPSPEENAATSQRSALLEKALDGCLTAREADVVRRRFFDNETLEEVSQTYGLTRERIRQIEAKALKTLRQNLPDGLL